MNDNHDNIFMLLLLFIIFRIANAGCPEVRCRALPVCSRTAVTSGAGATVQGIPDTRRLERGEMPPFQEQTWRRLFVRRGARGGGRVVGNGVCARPDLAAVPALCRRGRPRRTAGTHRVLHESRSTHDGEDIV